jgi:hypothetical protein
MLRLDDGLSIAGGAGANEDAWGWRDDGAWGSAWVIDGATGLDDREHVPDGPTDAAWHARALAAAFAAAPIADDDPAPAIARMIAGIAARWRAAVADPDAVPAWGLPTSAGMWCRARPAGDALDVDVAWLGDCVAILAPPTGPTVTFNRGALEAADGRLRQRIQGLSEAGAEPTSFLGALKDELRARRAMANRPDGYWAFGVVPEAAAHLKRARRTVPRGSRLLLVTDGFYRLVDHFALYDDATLVDAARHRGLAALGAQLRAAERADGRAQAAPRVKPHDDATAALFTLGA